MKISIVDILLFGYVIMTIGSSWVLQGVFVSFVVAKWGLFLLCYVVARSVQSKRYCLWSIVLLGIIEAITALFQQMEWVENSYSMFHMTGTFANPGPLGGFLSIALTILVGLYIEECRNHEWKQWGLFPMLILLSVVLVQTDSRAGWLAVLSGISSFLFARLQKKTNACFRKKSILLLGTLFLGILLLTFIYFYKKDSADGRLLIWRVSAEMMVDAPLLGHGVGAFAKQYMYYQARYFESHPFSSYDRLADNVAYPYNELLRIGVELGIIGLLLVAGIIICVFKYVPGQGYNKIYRGAFAAWIMFSMFSYPSHVLLLWLLVPILLGGLQCQNGLRVEVRSRFTLMKWLVVFGGLFFVAQSGYNYYLLKNRVRQLLASSPQIAEAAARYVGYHQQKLLFTPRLMDIYSQYSYQNDSLPKKQTVLEKAVDVIPNSELFCDLGDVYKELHQIDKAVRCYVLAGHMVPHRLLPHYKLFCLYRETGDTVKMREVGEKALYMQVKVESTKTWRMRGDIKRTLNVK